jgi:ribosomal protein S18 acetylase RimI-like enzyme
MLAEWKLIFANEYRRFLHALVGTTGDALVVTAEGAVLGYLIFEERATISGSSARIIAFRVIPQYRGLGYGRALLAELMVLARQAGWERISVDVGVGAERAMHLYKSVGFEPTSMVLEVFPGQLRFAGPDSPHSSAKSPVNSTDREGPQVVAA